jgi:hypothetical protein
MLTRSHLVLLTLSAVACACSAHHKERYDLAQQCAKSAADWFNRTYLRGGIYNPDGALEAEFQNHYNSQINECFVLVKAWPTKQEGLTLDAGKRESLWDVNESKEYGFYILDRSLDLNCRVSTNPCHSKDEWDTLIKPYMEN